MRKISAFIVLSSILAIGFTSSYSYADSSIKITDPANGATVASPVKVCLETNGVVVEPAKNGVNEGRGHHHLLIDADLPTDLTQPIAKDDKHVHMGDGSTCKELTLSVGKHTIRALFANGAHVPGSPALTASVDVTVK